MKRYAVVLSATLISLFASNQVSLAQHGHAEMTSMTKQDKKEKAVVTTDADTTKTTSTSPKGAASMKDVVARYLELKNALVGDKTKEAAKAGSALEATFKEFDKTELTPEQKKVYDDVVEDAREHAEHIGANAGNLSHQREHFDILSKDMYDLVKAIGTDQVLYKIDCSMYNDKKGAIWLSETKEIKNPYYGKKMITCGSVREEIK